MTKTHLLYSPDKNYLGFQDLPEGKDIIVTISKAGMERVKDPIKQKETNEKKVIHFEEDVKPMILNMTNSAILYKLCGVSCVEDLTGHKIQLYVGETKMRGVKVECLRIREKKPMEKEKLTPEHPKWRGAVDKINEGHDADYLRKWYDLDEENETLLFKAANGQ